MYNNFNSISDSKVYMLPEGGDNSALYAALANNGGMNNWMNNPFAYLMFLPFMYGMANGNFGGYGNRNGYSGTLAGADVALGATTQANIASLSNQVQNLGDQINGNANFGQLGTSIEGVKSQLGDLNVSNVGAFANMAQDINGVQSAILSTGCGIKSAVTEQGYQNLLANCQQTNTILQQSLNLSNTVLNGFTQLGFLLERNACDIKETSLANTLKIVDTLNNKWSQDASATITQLLDKLATLEQTNALIAALKTNTTTAG